jgi:hypothetical protein
LALKEVDPVVLHRQSGIHAQEILEFKIAPHKEKSIVKKNCLAGTHKGEAYLYFRCFEIIIYHFDKPYS